MNTILTLADTTNNTGSWFYIIMIVVLFAALYFFTIRPQKKQEKETNAMLNGLQVGDEITTIGGIIGKIVSIKDETCMIETGRDRTKIRILKTSVKRVDVPASVANGTATKNENENTDAAAPSDAGDDKKKKKK
jgi:preprotein translocase subunit YajC